MTFSEDSLVRSRTTYVDTTTVVCNLQQLEASVFDEDFDGRGASVDSIFDQLLQRMDWRYDDLSRSDLVDYILCQCLYRPFSP